MKMTLFKKIFLTIFVGLFVVQAVNVYLDYKNIYRNIVTSCVDHTLAGELSYIQDEYEENPDSFNEEDFIQKTENVVKNYHDYAKDGQGYYGYSKGFNEIVRDELNIHYFKENAEIAIQPNEQFHDTQFYISLKNISLQQRESLEKVIIEDGETKALHIQYHVAKEWQETDEWGRTFTYAEPDYLEINGKTIIGKNTGETSLYYIYSYKSPSLYYRVYTGNEITTPMIIQQKDLMKKLRVAAKDMYDEYGAIGSTRIGYQKKDDDLYVSYRIWADNKLGDDTMDWFQFVKYYPNVFDDLMSSALYANKQSNLVSLFISFFMSLGISYMMTKRIKKIDKSTREIANNHFDMKLEEKPYDELGRLSHNINVMSQRLKLTMNQLNEEIENVKKLESLRKEFIANFTHEIKTPLGIIDGYIELVEAVQDENKKLMYLEAISQETNRINELVLAMLNLSRLESGKIDLDIQDVDLEDLISSTIDSYAGLLEKKNIQIELTGEEVYIQADPVQLQMVIKNFMSNAIKHTPDDMKIYVYYDSHMFSIENEGSHIDEDKMSTIWETYVSSDREGTGLGLAICKTILDMHRFSYKVENTERGVRFTVEMKTEKE